MSSPSARCLVIGGRGFVGSALVDEAAAAGWDVAAVGREDYAERAGEAFDLVIHANGNARRFKANAEPLWDFEASVRPVYRAVLDFPAAHHALISSVDVYNDPSRIEATTEEVAIDLVRLPPYGFHKRLAELCMMRHARSWQIFRLAQMVSPRLSKGPIYDLLQGQPLWIDPASELPYLTTQHAARAVIDLVAHAPRGEIYNVCGRGSVPFHRVLELLDATAHCRTFAGYERQVYRIDTTKTHRLSALPDSWNEIRTFIAAAKPRAARS